MTHHTMKPSPAFGKHRAIRYFSSTFQRLSYWLFRRYVSAVFVHDSEEGRHMKIVYVANRNRMGLNISGNLTRIAEMLDLAPSLRELLLAFKLHRFHRHQFNNDLLLAYYGTSHGMNRESQASAETRRRTLYVVANAAGAGLKERGISGGDVIVINWLNKWLSDGRSAYVIVGESGYKMYHERVRKAIRYIVTNRIRFARYFMLNSVMYDLLATLFACLVPIKTPASETQTILCASDFWPDVIPASLLHVRRPKSKLAACVFLTVKFTEPDERSLGSFLKNGLHYFSQKLALSLLRRYANIVFVMNEIDKAYLIRLRFSPKIIKVIDGGVDLDTIRGASAGEKLYDACFVGRLTPQKGISDLLRIWKIVCETKHDARLAIIGSGSRYWTRKLVREIHDIGLTKNIVLLGFLDEREKYSVLKSSSMALLPSRKESWALAVCEAMACGLPVVAYDLATYPKGLSHGIIKERLGDTSAMAKRVLTLLDDHFYLVKLGHESAYLAEAFDWSITVERPIELLAA